MSGFWVPEYTRLRFIYCPQGPLSPQEYLGSAWRGAFGHSLRAQCCNTALDNCGNCPRQQACNYTYLFETPTASTGGGVNTNAPHPLILRPLPQGGHDKSCTVEVTLVGRARRMATLVAEGLCQAGLRGVGSRSTIFRLETVQQHDGNRWTDHPATDTVPLTPPAPESVTLHLLTPLRLKQGNDLATAENMNPTGLLLAIRQRMLHLSQYHGDGAGLAECHLPYLAPESAPAHSKELHWVELERHSSRQQRSHKMGGLIGHVDLSLQGLEAFWPALWHGQYLHVGKLTTMGLGAYRIELPQACQARERTHGFDTVAAIATRGACR